MSNFLAFVHGGLIGGMLVILIVGRVGKGAPCPPEPEGRRRKRRAHQDPHPHPPPCRGRECAERAA